MLSHTASIRFTHGNSLFACVGMFCFLYSTGKDDIKNELELSKKLIEEKLLLA